MADISPYVVENSSRKNSSENSSLRCENGSNEHQKDNSDEELLREIYGIVVPILMLLCFLGILINLIVLIVTGFAPKNRRSPAFRFAVSLMIADAWVSTLMAVVFLVNSYGSANNPNFKPACFHLATEGFRLGAIITSIYHLLIAGKFLYF